MQFVGYLAEGDPHVREEPLAHVLVRGEYPGFSPNALDSLCLLFIQDSLIAAQPLNVRLVDQIVVGISVAVEQAPRRSGLPAPH